MCTYTLYLQTNENQKKNPEIWSHTVVNICRNHWTSQSTWRERERVILNFYTSKSVSTLGQLCYKGMANIKKQLSHIGIESQISDE